MTLDWDELYRLHAPHLRRVIHRRVDGGAVEDVLQETFLRAFRSRAGFDPMRPIEPWLTTIAVRASLDHRAAAQAEAMPTPEDGRRVADAAETYAAFVQRRLIVRALDSLSGRHRELLHAVAVEGVSQAGIARREGVSPDAVRAAVARARDRFRVALERAVQEHGGLAGLGSGTTPVLARLRGRLLPVESLGSRPVEALVALVMATTVAATAFSTAPPPSAFPSTIERGTSHVTSHVIPGVTSGSPPHPDAHRSGTIQTKVGAPGAGVNGSLGRDDRELDTMWTLRIDPVGAEFTIGTDDRTGRVGVRVHNTRDGRATNTEAGAGMSQCDANAGTHGFCTAYETVAVLATSEGDP